MAAGTLDSPNLVVSLPKKAAARRATAAAMILKPLSSLKLTVALFAYGIFVVLVGTFAQAEMDIWQVVPLYFRSLIMWVDVNLFFPPAFFPQMPHLDVPLIPLPGGLTVGLLMLANLGAAHAWRFQVHAKGGRLLWGLVALAVAVAITTLVIVSGNIGTGIQAKPVLSPRQIWFVFCALLVGGWLASTYGVAFYAWRELGGPQQPKGSRSFGQRLLAMVFVGYLAWTGLVIGLVSNLLAPPTESMRILWQLLQAEAAGLALLGACYLLFAKRAGIVLLHGGVVLMMVSELVVARYAIEWQMFLSEGQALNYVRDTRTVELAFIDRSLSEGERVVVIPRKLLEKNHAENERLAKAGKPLAPIRDAAGTHERLPVDVTVLEYYRNHNIRSLETDEKPLATKGVGLEIVAEEARPVTGTDMDRGNDVTAAYVKLTEKKTGRDLGTYLLSQLAEENVGRVPQRFQQSVEVGGKKYDMLIRYERQYKPYTVKLEDVRKDDYLGSDTPKNYSSDVQLIDPESGVSSKIHIKMNDPLRYRGDTFYQNGYHPVAPMMGQFKEATTLAVVNNVGWMIPYTACMIVVTGLVFQFSIAMQRFLNRRADEDSRLPLSSRHYQWMAVAIAAIVALGYIGSKLSPPSSEKQRFNTVEFGKLPVVSSGRVKPIDTLARNSLRALSNYETLRIKRGDKTVRLSAVEWLLDTVTRKEGAADYPVIKVDHPDLNKLFNLQPAPKNLYSVVQLADKVPELTEMARAAFQKKERAPETLTTLDRKALELFDRVKVYDSLVEAFSPPRIPPVPTPEETQEDPQGAQRKALAFQQWMMEFPREVRARELPLLIPIKPAKDDPAQGHWLPYPLAFWEALRSQATQEEASPLTQQFAEMLSAYAADRPTDFQRAMTQYQAEVRKLAPQDYVEDKVAFETYFNHVSPFYVGATLCVLALVLALAGFLLQSRPTNLAATTIIIVALLLHTLALAARVYISGRPPVTNLYSSAVFIGWGCVLFCLVAEIIFLNGLGNIVGALTGFASLLIAYFLAAGGDTISVLQAVLDTQFWLATHVVLITLGYTATYIAGFFGLCYVVLGISTPRLTENMRAELARMIYGVTCFAITLSFFGTVLGGLWADDSWGRFWGWDPKENGALIIVMWNALVLHAKWDKLVKDRGLALLAIGGNVITSWSWFGVNELGLGLHTYGFTEGVLRALLTFAFYMFVCVGFGLVPLRLWWSETRRTPLESVSGPIGITFAMVNVAFLSAFSYYAYVYLA